MPNGSYRGAHNSLKSTIFLRRHYERGVNTVQTSNHHLTNSWPGQVQHSADLVGHPASWHRPTNLDREKREDPWNRKKEREVDKVPQKNADPQFDLHEREKKCRHNISELMIELTAESQASNATWLLDTLRKHWSNFFARSRPHMWT